ncbi:MAG TPA: hypothetical protein VIX86_25005 [Streptosporangiaceae bacterium]
MKTQLPPASEITDQDRRRACRLAHVVGGLTALIITALLAAPFAFRSHPLPLVILLAVGPVVVLAAGVVADLAVRPPRVRLAGTVLTVTRFARSEAVHIDRLTGLSAVPSAAGVVRLTDDQGGQAHIDVRCLARNPLIWEQVDDGVRQSGQQGSLPRSQAESQLWLDVASAVDHTQRRMLAALDFEPH